ncbi:DUF7344 domain-containing protein [Natrinema salsiterrestre]|uniref:DUF7344 domain-containing protein n=1 Tax=Natrinema salsiterrestre TaxID=2950540 RepID=A0A9Q4L6W0_9EURY|nr:hypothetical protein [Natrinema salsiterrestre]MDF9748354.1 hypothetical protein [Natrinema salsiterrestre]
MGFGGCYPDKAPMIDRFMDTLSNSVRRETIHYFENHNSGKTSTVDEVVAHIEARVPDKDREELSLLLQHKHLPKLQSRGWLEFENRSDTIRYHGNELAQRWLEDVVEVFDE